MVKPVYVELDGQTKELRYDFNAMMKYEQMVGTGFQQSLTNLGTQHSWRCTFQDYHTKTKVLHHNVWLRCYKRNASGRTQDELYAPASKRSIKADTCKKKCIKHSEKRWTMNTNQTMKQMKKMRITTTQKTSKAMGVQRLNEVRHCNTEYKAC
jgi:hypothetical protein